MPASVAVVGKLNMNMEVSVPNLPGNNSEIIGKDLEYTCSGNGFDISKALSGMGTNVRVIGCVGNDVNGKILVATLQKNCINTDSVKISSVQTGSEIIFKAPDGHFSVLVDGANSELNENFIKFSTKTLRSCDYVLYQDNLTIDTCKAIKKEASSWGTKVIFNPLDLQNITDEILDLVDVLVINSNNPLEDVKKYKEKFEGLIFAYSESDGAVYFDGSEIKSQVPYKTVHKYEGGDKTAFLIALLSALSKKAIPADAVDFALYVAAATFLKEGALSAIPTIDELKTKKFKDMIC